jgi:preprotein translocase subunit YajC
LSLLSENFTRPSLLYHPQRKNTGSQISLEISLEKKAKATTTGGLCARSTEKVEGKVL